MPSIPSRFRPRPFAVCGRWHRLRRWANLLNLSTPAGLFLARLTGCRVDPGPYGTLLAEGYPLALPRAAAFTIGNVVFYRPAAARRISTGRMNAGNSPLLRHEMRHSTQYAVLGPLFLPLYFAAAVFSRLLTGNAARANPFERLAGLADGGYRQPPAGTGGRPQG